MKKMLLFIMCFCLIIIAIPSITKSEAFEENKCHFTPDLKNTVEVENIDKCYNNKLHERVRIPKEIKKLMIVAHPDDESLWGGGHLIEDNYTVVCVTCGVVNYRVTEFIKAMTLTNDKYVMLGYPDLSGNRIDRWETSYSSITESLKKIINSEDWDVIVTHNPEGEYGHIQHIMTSKIVTDLVSDKNKLFYFGRYYKEGQIPSDLPTLNIDTYNKKVNDLLSIYVSQPKAMKRHKYIINNENWLNFYEW